MRILLLFPSVILFAISFYNLAQSSTAVQPNFAIIVLHAFVMTVCLVFSGAIIKSMFTVTIEEVEVNETEGLHQTT